MVSYWSYRFHLLRTWQFRFWVHSFCVFKNVFNLFWISNGWDNQMAYPNPQFLNIWYLEEDKRTSISAKLPTCLPRLHSSSCIYYILRFWTWILNFCIPFYCTFSNVLLSFWIYQHMRSSNTLLRNINDKTSLFFIWLGVELQYLNIPFYRQM